MKSENKIADLSFDFAISVIDLYKELVEKKEFVLSKQLLRSGTSIGANVEEAIAAQSRKDFISKMSIASKEARETRYWLRLLNKSKLVGLDYQPYLESIEHIINILTKIVKTTVQSPEPIIQNSTFKI
jgi:four helix bundle protein